MIYEAHALDFGLGVVTRAITDALLKTPTIGDIIGARADDLKSSGCPLLASDLRHIGSGPHSMQGRRTISDKSMMMKRSTSSHIINWEHHALKSLAGENAIESG